DLLAIADAAGAAEIAGWLHRVDSTAAILVTGPRADSVAAEPARQVVDGMRQDLGTEGAMHAWPAADLTPAAFRALGEAADLLTGDITVLDPAGVNLVLR